MTKEYKAQEFEIEWHRAILAWCVGGKVGADPNSNYEVTSDLRSPWVNAKTQPSFTTGYYFRWKPAFKRTVTINGKVLIAPEVVAPENGTVVWCSTHLGEPSGMCFRECEKTFLERGFVFLDKEDARAMADWLTKCRKGECESITPP